MILVDTDIIIWYIKKNEEAIKFLDSNKGFKISCVTYIELVQNARNKAEVNKIHKSLKFWNCETIYINDKISMLATMNVEKYCLSHSHELGDALIGATALVNNYDFYSGNKKKTILF